MHKNTEGHGALQALTSVEPGEELAAGLDRVERSLGLEVQSAREGDEKEVTGATGDGRAPRELARPAHVPVAIVAMGAVLPGSRDPDEYWCNMVNGKSGIVDLAALDLAAKRDFVAGSANGELNIVPDKTYTLLNGSVLDLAYDEPLLRSFVTRDQFQKFSRGQKLLAVALGQCSLKRPLAKMSGKLQCIIGATADGSSELDDAAFVESIQEDIDCLDEPAASRDVFKRLLQEISGYKQGDEKALSQWNMYKRVVAHFLPDDTLTYIVDSACSSSLYAVSLGMKALAQGEADLVVAGGVFAPGPANNTLFAQFRGLSPTGSRPLDETADGVVFGEGSAVVALKRLPDALADGDEVLGVIRGIGLSSDGKSPSINVPQTRGQKLAVSRALRQAGTDIDTIQYIEAHATATPVGDKVEVNSLFEIFRERRRGLPPIVLGSGKALIGHTGWVSGTAAIVKLCKAFAERTIPKQYNFVAPSADLIPETAPFTIATSTLPWPENIDGQPRRAGINGFGFGGTNAHVVIEQFDPFYHRRLCRDEYTPGPRADLAIVALGCLFPDSSALAVAHPSAERRFPREKLVLPRNKILLPDVTDHMDPSQYLAALASEKIMDRLSDKRLERDDIGVVLGLESKTERGINANKRIFLDRLNRWLAESGKLEGPDRAARASAQPFDQAHSGHADPLGSLHAARVDAQRDGQSSLESLRPQGTKLRHRHELQLAVSSHQDRGAAHPSR